MLVQITEKSKVNRKIMKDKKRKNISVKGTGKTFILFINIIVNFLEHTIKVLQTVKTYNKIVIYKKRTSTQYKGTKKHSNR